MSNNVLNLAVGREDERSRPRSVDQAGPAAISLLRQAADVATRNKERAKHLVQQLAAEVRAAQDRIKALESDLRDYQDRAEQAEQWLSHIHAEIQDIFAPMLATGIAKPAPGYVAKPAAFRN
jgi:chromosome segregation ATPase